jgi:hypothetical protein
MLKDLGPLSNEKQPLYVGVLNRLLLQISQCSIKEFMNASDGISLIQIYNPELYMKELLQTSPRNITADVNPW